MNPPIKKPLLKVNKAKVVESLANALGGIGPGVGGFVSGMTRSEPAGAPVMDETRTRAYQGALARQRQGQGDLPTRSGSLWQALTRTGPTANQTLQAAQQRQAVFDEQTRQPGRPSVTEERMLLDMNQTNPRAYRR